jgi:serine/threonine protein kinase
MSPEQCEGKGAIDHRSDIYSLGVVLYELLTGTVPFGGDIRDILLAHLQRRPDPPSLRNPAVPPSRGRRCACACSRSTRRIGRSRCRRWRALGPRAPRGVYAAAQAARAASGHSGHTLIATERLTRADRRRRLATDGARPPRRAARVAG